MAGVGDTALTLADLAKRVDPDGGMALIVEALAKKSPGVQDALWKESNARFINRTTRRVGLPTIHRRSVNKGIPPSKSVTGQLDDVVAMFEAESKVDARLVAGLDAERLKATRWGEDVAFVEAMGQQCESDLFYANHFTEPDAMHGLAPRFASLAHEQVINAGGSGSDCSSAWFVTWDQNAVHGLYGQGQRMGWWNEDLGRQRVEDADGNSLMAYINRFYWDVGLCVRDERFVSRVANIDIGALGGGTPPDIIEPLVEGYHRLEMVEPGKTKLYVNRDVYLHLHLQAMDKSNVNLSLQDFAGRQVVMFIDVPVRKTDGILSTEAALT